MKKLLLLYTHMILLLSMLLSVWVYAADKTDRHKFVEHMQDWYSTQTYGFDYLEEYGGFWLNNKNVHADARNEIIEYFVSMIPTMTEEIEKALL